MGSSFDDRGATTIEHALVLPAYIFLLLISCEFIRVIYNHISLQFAITAASRRFVVQPLTNPASEVRSFVNERMAQFGLALSPQDVVIACPVAALPGCRDNPKRPTVDSYDRGAPNQPIAFEVYRTVNLFGLTPSIGLTNIELMARVFANNEPSE